MSDDIEPVKYMLDRVYDKPMEFTLVCPDCGSADIRLLQQWSAEVDKGIKRKNSIVPKESDESDPEFVDEHYKCRCCSMLFDDIRELDVHKSSIIPLEEG